MKMNVKNIFVLSLCLLLAVAASAQNQLNRIDAKGKKQGPWKKYENGILIYEGQFENDVPKGTFRYYFPNGKLKSVSEFVAGVSKVKVVTYHENGNVASEGVFVDQQKDGQWKYYSDKNVLLSEENYKLGKKNGLFVTYGVGGNKLKQENFVNDVLDGECISYYENEEPFIVQHYINGKLNGELVSYFPGKVVAQKGLYYNNLKTGLWEFNDNEGKIRKTEEYGKTGRVSKTYLYLYANGNPQKINQDLVAYFVKKGETRTAVMLKNGNRIEATESMIKILEWVDMLDFLRVTPNLYAAASCIKGYKDIDATTVKVNLKPALDYEVVAQDNDAMFIRSLFNTDVPEE